jgi:hypothetical protein
MSRNADAADCAQQGRNTKITQNSKNTKNPKNHGNLKNSPNSTSTSTQPRRDPQSYIQAQHKIISSARYNSSGLASNFINSSTSALVKSTQNHKNSQKTSINTHKTSRKLRTQPKNSEENQ